MRQLLTYVGLVIAAIVILVGVVSGYAAMRRPLTTQADQAQGLSAYVQQNGISPEQADATWLLAQSDATLRGAKTDQYRAETERMPVEDARIKAIRAVVTEVIVILLLLLVLAIVFWRWSQS